jgi:hypothetical protein
MRTRSTLVALTTLPALAVLGACGSSSGGNTIGGNTIGGARSSAGPSTASVPGSAAPSAPALGGGTPGTSGLSQPGASQPGQNAPGVVLTVAQLKTFVLSPTDVGDNVQVISEFDSDNPPTQQQLAAYSKAVNGSQPCTDFANSFITAAVSTSTAGSYINVTYGQGQQPVAQDWMGSFSSVSAASQAMSEIESDLRSCPSLQLMNNGQTVTVSLRSAFSIPGAAVIANSNDSLAVVASTADGQNQSATAVMRLGSQLIAIQTSDPKATQKLAEENVNYLTGNS